MNIKFVSNAFLLLLILLGGATVFGQKLTSFVKNERLGYKDARGKIVIPARFIMAGDFSKEGLAIVVDGEGWALINRTGRVVIRTPFIFDGGPDDFAENLARFTVDEKFGFYDRRGKTVVAPHWDFALSFHQGLAAVCLECRKTEADAEGHYGVTGGRWGYINRLGAVVIPLKFEAAEDFENGRTRVKLNGKTSFIDERGAVLKR